MRTIHWLSSFTKNPEWAKCVMQKAVRKDIRLASKTQTANFLADMWKIGIGTNEVENTVRKVTSEEERWKEKGRKIVKDIMETKWTLAKKEVRTARQEVEISRRTLLEVVKSRGTRKQFFVVHQEEVSENIRM